MNELHSILFSPITLRELEVLIEHSVERGIKKYFEETERQEIKPQQSNFGIDGLLDLIEEETGKRPAKQTIYGLVYRGEIPFYKPTGTKQLRFNHSEITEWLNNGRQVNHIKDE